MAPSRAALGLLVALTACAGQPDLDSRPVGPPALLLRDVTLIDGTPGEGAGRFETRA